MPTENMISLYYQDDELHEYRVDCAAYPAESEVEECRQLLIQMLISTQGFYKRPVLALIQGGKV